MLFPTDALPHGCSFKDGLPRGCSRFEKKAKRVRALRKKLRQIAGLRAKRAAGGQLNEVQIAKISKEAAHRAELQGLESQPQVETDGMRGWSPP